MNVPLALVVNLAAQVRSILLAIAVITTASTGASALDQSVSGKFVKTKIPFALNSLCQLQNGKYSCVDYSIVLPTTIYFSNAGTVLYYLSDRTSGNDGTGMQFPATGGKDSVTMNGGTFTATYRPTSSGFDITLEYDGRKDDDRWKFKLASRVQVQSGRCSSQTAVSGAFTTQNSGWTPEGSARLTGSETCTISNSR